MLCSLIAAIMAIQKSEWYGKRPLSVGMQPTFYAT
ncbi:Uncharacterised protein [Metakosakonia massiliensis]|uniref:Uncharacterized protein n=1 Tax=Phytobacter massiliensis TaxID=1485952 RepID=A0A6N3AQ98_9ENTR